MRVTFHNIFKFRRFTKIANLNCVVLLGWLPSIALFNTSGVYAQATTEQDPQLKGIDVVEHLGGYPPLDISFTTDQGHVTTLGEFLKTGKPTILNLAYYNCPMLCNLVMNGISKSVGELEWTTEEKFQILTISINPHETVELAAAKKANYLKEFAETTGKKLNPSTWTFAVTSEKDSRRLADAIGFKYYYVSETKEYAHPGVIFILAPDGKITRYLYGIDFSARDMKLALLEASEGKIGTSMDRFIMYCFQYDPLSKSYALMAINVMKLGGLLTIALLGVFLVILWRKERRRKMSHPVVAGT